MTTFFNWRISTELNRKTQKEFWVNGHHVRGKDFHTFAASFRNKAVLLSFSWSGKYLSFNTYKLF